MCTVRLFYAGKWCGLCGADGHNAADCPWLGKDIHRERAATIFGVKPEDVTPEQRRAAKMINYHRIYGV